MKIFFLLSDSNVGILIGAISTVVVAMVPVFILLGKVLKNQAINKKQTDGMKDELVRSTAELNKILGNIEGRKELKQELNIGDADISGQIESNRKEIEKLKTVSASEPVAVVVKNAEPIPVVTKNSDK